MADRVLVKSMLGDYPITAAFRRGEITSPVADFAFADVKVPNTAFKRTVRDGEFDLSELAIVTHLMAKAQGKPFVLLPAVVVGRFQHPFLFYNAERGTLTPDDLNGKRIGVRSYSVTTVTWIRGILQADHGLDLSRCKWITFEEGHVAEVRDPPNAERAPAGKEVLQMLIDGELDAAVLGAAPRDDPRIRTVFPDPGAAGESWGRRNQAIQINHMVVVKAALSGSRPDVVREIWRLLKEAKSRAGLPRAGELDTQPFGLEANRHNLEIAIDYVYRQHLIPRRFSVDELFDDVTGNLS